MNSLHAYEQVVRCCVEHAAAVAKTFLTSDVVVVDTKEAESISRRRLLPTSNLMRTSNLMPTSNLMQTSNLMRKPGVFFHKYATYITGIYDNLR